MKIFHQTLHEIFLPDLAQNFSDAIVIVIDLLIRIDRTLIENFLPDYGYEMLRSWK